MWVPTYKNDTEKLETRCWIHAKQDATTLDIWIHLFICTIMQKHIKNDTDKLGAGYTHADKLDSGIELNYGGGRVGAGGIDSGLYLFNA